MIEVTYVSHMGDDLTVVNAARVSFGKKSEWHQRIYTGEPNILKGKDAKLIRYLAKHNHKSPFNHTFATFHVKAPVFVARQLQKHEYMPWNEVSRRYVDDEPQFYMPFMWRERAENKKQGSAETEVEFDITDITKACKIVYNDMLEKNIAPEMARMVLPQNMMTEWYWTGSVMAFARVCNLRNKDDTQAETRMITMPMAKHLKDHFPMSAKYLLD